MKEVVEVVARALVNEPEKVVVTQTEQKDSIVVELHVAPEDMGRVIGKSGRIASAIRNVVKAVSSREGKKVIVDIR